MRENAAWVVLALAGGGVLLGVCLCCNTSSGKQGGKGGGKAAPVATPAGSGSGSGSGSAVPAALPATVVGAGGEVSVMNPVAAAATAAVPAARPVRVDNKV